MSENYGVGASAINGGIPVNKDKKKSIPKKRGKKITPLFSRGVMDLSFFIIVIFLLAIGIVMMFSASYAWSLTETNGRTGTYYAEKQLVMAGIGLAAMFFFSYFDYHHFSKPKMAIGIFSACMVGLLMVFTPLGVIHNGARRWLKIGIEFQPSELMKFAIIVLFAYLIVKNYNRMDTFKYGILPFGLILGVVAFILMEQPHLSCTVLICTIAGSLMLVGGVKFKHIGILLLVGAGGLVALVVFKAMGQEGMTYFVKRFQPLIDPFSDATGSTWQTCQSLIAIGSGGFFGLGLGESRQKFMYLPETQNDFVFSIVCEELGFMGAVTIILLFSLLVVRGFFIANRAKDKFGMLIVVGITVQIGVQAFLNIAVVTNSLPNTGISLPFFSYGGTALIMQLAEIGVILNVSRQGGLNN